MTKVFNSSLTILTLAGSQPHIPTIIATPVIEKSTSAKILSPTVEDEFDSFVKNDLEDNDNGCSETLDLIDIQKY